MTAPKRIQLRRTKGWRKPDGAIVVARPSKWGNPFTVVGAVDAGFAATLEDARYLCTVAFRSVVMEGERSRWWFHAGADRFDWIMSNLEDLRGHDLACWCPLEDEQGNRVPCHADVLLELANGERP